MSSPSRAARLVVGSHTERRHPTPEEIGRVTDSGWAVPVEAPANSVVCWDGAVWHTGGHRTAPGERVVLHLTYTRLSQRQIEDYSHITDEVIERAAPDPAMFRVLLGRMGYFHRSRARMGWVGDGLFPQMLPMVKGHASREHILETSELAREDPGGIGVKEAAAAARIAELEEEVAALRSQLAKI